MKFKQIAMSDGVVCGLTEDGEVYLCEAGANTFSRQWEIVKDVKEPRRQAMVRGFGPCTTYGAFGEYNLESRAMSGAESKRVMDEWLLEIGAGSKAL